MKNSLIVVFSVAVVAVAVSMFNAQPQASAHCQIPCGIYDDAARLNHMLEDTATITKAMAQIREMGGNHDAQSINQVGRWIMTKEDHASHIISTVAEYFLTQKVKEVPKGDDGHQAYLELLATHHHVMRAAMKAKQSVDAKVAEDLKNSIHALQKRYK